MLGGDIFSSRDSTELPRLPSKISVNFERSLKRITFEQKINLMEVF